MLDRFDIESATIQQCGQLVKVLTSGGSYGDICNLVTDACRSVLAADAARRAERKCNRAAAGKDIVNDQRDKEGRRRFTLGCLNDEPVMVPDEEGFWTPVNG